MLNMSKTWKSAATLRTQRLAAARLCPEDYISAVVLQKHWDHLSLDWRWVRDVVAAQGSLEARVQLVKDPLQVGGGPVHEPPRRIRIHGASWRIPGRQKRTCAIYFSASSELGALRHHMAYCTALYVGRIDLPLRPLTLARPLRATS